MIYYLLIEAVPYATNDESKEFGGAYVNCWIKATNQQSAIKKAKAYIASERWETVNIEEIYLSNRNYYYDEPELKSCFDFACEHGVGAIFNTWSLEEKESYM